MFPDERKWNTFACMEFGMTLCLRARVRHIAAWRSTSRRRHAASRDGGQARSDVFNI